MKQLDNGLVEARYRLTGTRPILMHNGQLADPANPFVKEIKKIPRKKSDEDYETLKNLEWRASLYLDDTGNVVVPADNIWAMIVSGAKKFKEGPAAKAGVIDADPHWPLLIDGAKSPTQYKKLEGNIRYYDYRGVKVQASRIMRSRPIFRNWAVEIKLLIDSEIINIGQVTQSLEIAGQRLGLGDYRPRFGRFDVEEI